MMFADGGPGNAPDPGLPPPPLPYRVAGIGPGTDQADAMAANALHTMVSGAIPQGRGPGSSADVASPQQFVKRPDLEELLAATSIGDDTAAQALPGRYYPGTWDGEPGLDAPGLNG